MDHILVLDLAAVNDPRWKNTVNFGGKEFGGSGWAFCMLDNYGGRTGMHGAFKSVMSGLMDAYQNANYFKGIGITPEATEENPVSRILIRSVIFCTDCPCSNAFQRFSIAFSVSSIAACMLYGFNILMRKCLRQVIILLIPHRRN